MPERNGAEATLKAEPSSAPARSPRGVLTKLAAPDDDAVPATGISAGNHAAALAYGAAQAGTTVWSSWEARARRRSPSRAVRIRGRSGRGRAFEAFDRLHEVMAETGRTSTCSTARARAGKGMVGLRSSRTPDVAVAAVPIGGGPIGGVSIASAPCGRTCG
jgi:hypothetical protein